jgi:TRAP-type transport system periplasmic protein
MKNKKTTILLGFLAVLMLLAISTLGACTTPAPTTSGPATPVPTTTAPATGAPTTIAPVTTSAPATTSKPAAKVVELRLNSSYNATQISQKAFEWWADQINKQSNGSIHVTVYPTGVLSPSTGVYDTVVAGIADMGSWSWSVAPGKFPYADLLFYPLPFDNGWVAQHMVTDYLLHYANMPEFNQVHLLSGTGSGPNVYITTNKDKPILKPSDLAGQKMAVNGLVATKIMQAYGASPLSIAAPDLYDAYSKNVIGIGAHPIDMLKSWKLGDVAYSYFLPAQKMSGIGMKMMNLERWNSLSKSQQDLMTKVADEATEVFAKGWWYGDYSANQFFLSLKGRTINKESPADASLWQDPIKPVLDAYVADYAAKGVNTTEAFKFLQDTIKKYNALSPDEKTMATWVEQNLIK